MKSLRDMSIAVDRVHFANKVLMGGNKLGEYSRVFLLYSMFMYVYACGVCMQGFFQLFS